jgi:predicted Zn-dependent peptidase
MTTFPIEEHRLDNGLRVVLSEDRVAPVVAVNLWYDVGSRHERRGQTGIAHLFEHLMFEGSRQVKSGEHFRLVSQAGGSLNATTSTERTNYFETVPAEQLELMLWLESDRMSGLLDALTQESLDNQRDVVKNERRQRYDNVPYGTAIERLCTRLFPEGHPYHHQTIGSMEDLSAASLDDVRSFFRTYYAPNNCVLSIVGDIDADQVLKTVDRYFGSIPMHTSAPAPPSDGRLATPLIAADRITYREKVPAEAVYMGYRLPKEGDAALDHLEIAMAVLTRGRVSVFERALVRAEFAQQARAFVDRRVGGVSLGLLSARARSGVSADAVEQEMRAQLQLLADKGPDERDLDRAKALVERGWLDYVTEVEGRADELSRCATLFDDPGRMNTWLDAPLRTTAKQVQAAVADYLLDNHPVVLTYLPAEEGEAAA